MKYAILVIAANLLIGSSGAQVTGVLAELNAYYDSTRIKSGNIPAALVVTKRGEVLLERYEAGVFEGLSVPVDERTMFTIASATKSYAAALLLNLQKVEVRPRIRRSEQGSACAKTSLRPSSL